MRRRSARVTQNIAVFATVHVPMVHPVFAAKALTTVDHVSNGRAGLNIVCGWNPEEFGMFGLELIEERYEQGLEWFEIMNRIYTADAPFDYDGKFYKLKAVSGKPRPLQTPRPITLNAAFSPPGREFAAKAADYLFTTFTEIDKGREHIDDMKKRAAAERREVGVYTTCHVVCRPTQAEAEAYYEHYAVTMADSASLDHYVKQKQTFSGSHDEDAYRLHRKRFAAGAGTYPLVGTPAVHRRRDGEDFARRICRDDGVVREFQERAAVFHRDCVAAAERGGVAAVDNHSWRAAPPVAKQGGPGAELAILRVPAFAGDEQDEVCGIIRRHGGEQACACSRAPARRTPARSARSRPPRRDTSPARGRRDSAPPRGRAR